MLPGHRIALAEPPKPTEVRGQAAGGYREDQSIREAPVRDWQGRPDGSIRRTSRFLNQIQAVDRRFRQRRESHQLSSAHARSHQPPEALTAARHCWFREPQLRAELVHPLL